MPDNDDNTYDQDDAYFGAAASPLLARFGKHIPDGARVLDLGVGQGRNAVPLARQGCQVTGLDTSRVAVDTVNELAAADKLPLEVVRQDFREYEPPRNFDVVLCFGLMQLLDLQGCASLVERLHHWTRPGGTLFLTAWHMDDPSFDTLCDTWERRSARTFRSPDGSSHRLFLESGEILQLFFRWDVIHHREGLGKPHRHESGKEERHSEVEAVLIRPMK